MPAVESSPSPAPTIEQVLDSQVDSLSSERSYEPALQHGGQRAVGPFIWPKNHMKRTFTF